MSDNSHTRDTIISKAFESWADKTWFQVLAVILIVYLMIAPVVGPIIYNYINKQNTSAAVVESLEERDRLAKEEHRLDFEKAKQTYGVVKGIMKHYLELSSSDYIFLVEYHNGMENVMSGIQFCHFDMTLEVFRDGLQYIPSEKYRNEFVARYDILLNEEFESSAKAFYYKTEELKEVDRYLMQCINYIECKSCVLINITNEKGTIIGTLLFASLDENINVTEVYKCQREIEKAFKQKINKQ